MECPACGEQFLLGSDHCQNCGADLTSVEPPKPKLGKIHEMILEDPLSQLNAAEPILMSPADPVKVAVERMRKLRYGSVLVVEGDRLAGIFTERDLIKHFAGREEEIGSTTLGEVMTAQPQTLHEDDTIAHALNRMAVGGYRHIPIIRGGRPVGFISIRGILHYLVENAVED